MEVASLFKFVAIALLLTLLFICVLRSETMAKLKERIRKIFPKLGGPKDEGKVHPEQQITSRKLVSNPPDEMDLSFQENTVVPSDFKLKKEHLAFSHQDGAFTNLIEVMQTPRPKQKND